MMLDFLLLFTILILVKAASIENLDLFSVADYLDMYPQLPKYNGNIRENFLRNKEQRKILNNLDKLISNNSIRVDGISHLEVTSDWKKANDMENDFKDLITMKNVKYVYQRDGHWRTWRKLKDSEGKMEIICYKCQSKIYPNCTDCTSRGIWVIEEAMPPCPYELFSVINSNELCASNYTQLGDKLPPCPSIIKYADLTKSCNNPIITRWRFTVDYRISERIWTSVICGGREFCEILTLYQIRPEYVIFRVINTTNADIIYSRIMQNNMKNYACVNDCGVIDLKTYRVTKNKEKNTILNLLPKKSKRDSVKNTQKYGNKRLYSDITNNFLTTTSEKAKKMPKVDKTRRPKSKILDKTNISSYKWVNTGNGIYISVVEATTKSNCKKMIKENTIKDDDDDDDELGGRSISLY